MDFFFFQTSAKPLFSQPRDIFAYVKICVRIGAMLKKIVIYIISVILSVFSSLANAHIVVFHSAGAGVNRNLA